MGKHLRAIKWGAFCLEDDEIEQCGGRVRSTKVSMERWVWWESILSHNKKVWIFISSSGRSLLSDQSKLGNSDERKGPHFQDVTYITHTHIFFFYFLLFLFGKLADKKEKDFFPLSIINFFVDSRISLLDISCFSRVNQV